MPELADGLGLDDAGAGGRAWLISGASGCGA